jgi:hypothetical protein
MIERTAVVLISDELTFSMNGKFNILGMYTGDIFIPADPTPVAQLVFLFVIETAPDDPYQSLVLEIALPDGGGGTKVQIAMQQLVLTHSDQRRWILRQPVLVQNAILRPGPIEAKVIHERGEITPATPSILLNPPLRPPPA